MGRKPLIRGNNLDEKMASVEKILHSYKRKLGTKIVGIIPPAPMFAYVQQPSETGMVMSCVFPTSGKITKGAMAIGRYNHNKAVEFSCEVVGKSGGTSMKFETRKPVQLVDANLSVKPGDLLTVKVLEPLNEKGEFKVFDIYTCFLFEISMRNSQIKNILIDKLLAEEESDEGV